MPSLNTLVHPKDLKLNPSTFPNALCSLLNYLSASMQLEGMKPQPLAFKSASYALPEAS